MSSITCTSQANIAIANHQVITGQYWKDPVYQAITAKRIEGEMCHYCGTRPASLAHHNNPESYRSKEEYYRPENMTPCCGPCHHNYRRGLIICPVCNQHYMRPTSEKCSYCRDNRTSAKGVPSRGRRLRHPCGNNYGRQTCHRDGRTFVCPRSYRDAAGCDHYWARVTV